MSKPWRLNVLATHGRPSLLAALMCEQQESSELGGVSELAALLPCGRPVGYVCSLASWRSLHAHDDFSAQIVASRYGVSIFLG